MVWDERFASIWDAEHFPLANANSRDSGQSCILCDWICPAWLAAVAQIILARGCPTLTHSTIASRAFYQVRVETPESVPAKYAMAMWRFSCGWRTDSLCALSNVVASARSRVPRLPVCLFWNHGRRTLHPFFFGRVDSGFS